VARVEVLSEAAAERFVLSLLQQRGRLTTAEVESAARAEGKRCPDQTVLFLAKLRLRGKIRGEISAPARGWVWWVEEAARVAA